MGSLPQTLAAVRGICVGLKGMLGLYSLELELGSDSIYFESFFAKKHYDLVRQLFLTLPVSSSVYKCYNDN